MSHTPEPWVIIPPREYDGDDEEFEGAYVYPGGLEGDDGNPICIFGDPSGSATMFENSDNPKRIVDCVNAMAGIDDPAWTVERMVGLIKVIADLDKHPQYNKTDDDSWYLAVMGSTGIKNESIREARVLLSRMGDA